MSDFEIIDTATAADGREFRAIRKLDDDAFDANPRGNEVFGKIVHKGDSRYAAPQEGDLADEIAEAITAHDFPVVARWLRIFHDAVCVIPTGYRALDAGSRKDTDTVGNYFGISYATRDECNLEGTFDLDTVENLLRVGVAEYGDWAEGNVFGVLIQKADEDGEYDEDDSVDGLWGLIGHEHADQEGKRLLEEAVGLHELS
jgi:hypothetical protein